MQELNRMVEEHFDILHQMQELKGKDDDIKRAIFRYLIEHKMEDFFNINWKRLFRYVGLGDKGLTKAKRG
jgi:hypothetical protein